jgi:NCAIR mutase (PurE)-related protein
MDEAAVRQLLDLVAAGAVSASAATEQLKRLSVDNIGFARLDRHRQLRTGFPEVIYGEGKTPAQIAAIAEHMAASGIPVLGTRCTAEAYEAVRDVLPGAIHHAIARCITYIPNAPLPVGGKIVVATGGTTDIPVAEEAAITAEMTGCSVDRLWDVGVAGIHRLLEERSRLFAADVAVVVAGMEGALPSVVGGMVDCPVIAVPTSVGYGAAFGGLAPLLGMLNACAPGVAVVNIDNGFGAGYIAGMIARRLGDVPVTAVTARNGAVPARSRRSRGTTLAQ